MRVNIIRLLVPRGLGRACGQQLTSPTRWGFQHLQSSSKVLLRVSLEGTQALSQGCVIVS